MIRERHNPPSDPEEFDNLSMRLMGRLWEATDVKKHGRRGHAQHGVDFFGTGTRQPIPVQQR